MGKSDIMALARKYIEAGYSVVPIAPNGTTRPSYYDQREGIYKPAVWKAQQTAIPADAELARLFPAGHDWGIGLVMGEVSGNAEMMDFDDPDIFDLFYARCVENGFEDTVDRLVRVRTPSGGAHLYYRLPTPPPGNMHLAMRLVEGGTGAGGGVKMKALIETRGEGGQAVAPGSPGACHPSGKPYEIVTGDFAKVPKLLWEERNELHKVAASFHKKVERKATVVTDSVARRYVPAGGKRPGDDFNERATDAEVLEILLRYGWQEAGRRAGSVIDLTRPGKSVSEGSSGTLNHCGEGVFFCFSSSASPFEPEQAYLPFAVYALLEHGGDFSAAASELARQGYGEPLEAPGKSILAEAAPREVGKNRLTPLELPEGTLYGVAGDIVHALDPHTESDRAAILLQILAAFGNVIGRSAHFRVEGDRHYTNLFVAVVGESGKGRKGTSWGHVRSLFENIDAEWAEERVKGGLSSGEGLIYAVRDEEPATDRRLLTLESELATVLRVMEREGNTISARIRDAWDGRKISTMTRNSPMTASNAHISLIGHITKDELLRYLQRTETANGFANRILWGISRRSKLLPEGGDFLNDPRRPGLINKLSEAVRFARVVQEVVRDEEARALWCSVYEKLTDERPGLFGAVTSRAEAQVTRLSLLYALLDCSGVIRVDHLEAALAVWHYCSESARRIFGDALGDSVADSIVAGLRNAGSAGLTRTDITGLFKRNVATDQIARGLDLIVAARLARQATETTSGRSAERWFALEPNSLVRTNEKNERSEIQESAGGLSSFNSFVRQNGEELSEAEKLVGVTTIETDTGVQQQARSFLLKMLKTERVGAETLRGIAKNKGISNADLEQARASLGIVEEIDEYGGIVWRLPEVAK